MALDFFLGNGRQGGEGHHFSLTRQCVPNEIHLFKNLYIITLSGPPSGTLSLPLGLFQISGTCEWSCSLAGCPGHWSSLSLSLPRSSVQRAVFYVPPYPAPSDHPDLSTASLASGPGLGSSTLPPTPTRLPLLSPESSDSWRPPSFAPGGNSASDSAPHRSEFKSQLCLSPTHSLSQPPVSSNLRVLTTRVGSTKQERPLSGTGWGPGDKAVIRWPRHAGKSLSQY